MNQKAPFQTTALEKNRVDIITNISDFVHQFRTAMNDAGIHYSGEIIADGRLHRLHIDGHKPGTLNGAYVLHPDGVPAGWFQDYTTGLSQTWRADAGKITHQEIIAQQARIDELKRLREIEQHERYENAAAKANHLWGCARPASARHPYLAKKKVKPYNLRQIRESLVIPIYNQSDRLVNLQFISPDGEKRFLSGGRKKGCFFHIGERTNEVLICEGFATGASLHEETSKRVVVAFDAGNLLPVTKNIRELGPDSEIIVAGDNDLSGVGQRAANEAAAAVGGKVLIPDVAGADWNDVISGGRHD